MIKALSLGTGLVAGLTLIAKVYFEQSFDGFFPNADRIYQLNEHLIAEGSLSDIPTLSGGVAPGLRDEIPEIEAATRFTSFSFSEKGEMVFFDRNKRKYAGNVFLADSCLFDVLERPIVAGDPRETLARPMYAMISMKVAEMMGGVDAVMGQAIVLDRFPGKSLTVGGVFEDIPTNSHLDFTVLISLSSIKSFFSYDGRYGWMGNDRYFSYVRLREGVSAEDIAPDVRAAEERHHDKEMLKKSGVELTYSMKPIRNVHRESEEVRRMSGLLSVLALALIFTAIMNYVLFVVSSLVLRSKEIGARKCYGASPGGIYGLALAETLVDLLAGLAGAALVVFIFRKTIEDILGTAPAVMFNFGSVALLAAVCLMVLPAAGLATGFLFSRIAPASAFRNYRENKRRWKLGLLFLQIVAAAFLVSLLAVIIRQYDLMLKDNPGYEYERLAFCNLSGTATGERQRAMEEIRRLPDVEAVTGVTMHPFQSHSGNNAGLPGDDRDLFNIADSYYAADDYFTVMGIPIIEGRAFTPNIPNSQEVMISRSFAEKMKLFSPEWADGTGATGKSVTISEHSLRGSSQLTVCGVFEDFRIGYIGNEDTRPTAFFYRAAPSILLVKFQRLTPDATRRLAVALERIFPEKDIDVHTYMEEMTGQYVESRRFRDAVLAGSLVALVITLVGLVAYTHDEINRRRKETAIRRINGATIADILRMFMTDISRIALPATLIGSALSAYMAFKWQEQFSVKASLSPTVFILSALTVIAISLIIVTANCYRAATANPSKYIKE
jgi:putative ABC transport system permease protein